MSFRSTIADVPSSINKSFQPSELAYLAVTSKIENPLRDRIAVALHNKQSKQYLVHREWKDRHNKKADLAITDMANKVQCLIECKAHSAPTYQKGYSHLAMADLRKMYNSSHSTTELYFVFFLNQVHSAQPIESRFQHAIKYWKLLNDALLKHKYKPDITESVVGHWDRHMRGIGLDKRKSRHFPIKGGMYYKMKVTVHAHLYGPVRRAELHQIN